MSIEEVGVRVLEEELELEVEKRLKGRRSRCVFLRWESEEEGGAWLWLSEIELEDECLDDKGDWRIGEEPTDEPGEDFSGSRMSEVELALEDEEELLEAARSSGGMSG